MEITVKKADLVKELSLGQGVVEKKTTIPILSNVLVEAERELRKTAKLVKSPSGYPLQNPWLAIANRAIEILGGYRRRPQRGGGIMHARCNRGGVVHLLLALRHCFSRSDVEVINRFSCKDHELLRVRSKADDWHTALAGNSDEVLERAGVVRGEPEVVEHVETAHRLPR